MPVGILHTRPYPPPSPNNLSPLPSQMILKGGSLFFCKDTTVSPHGVIDLTECTDVRELGSGFDFSVAGPKEKYCLRAQNKREMNEWISAIKKAMSSMLSKQVYLTTYKDMLFQGQMFEKHHHDPVGRFNFSQKDSSRLVKVSRDGQRITWHKAGRLDVICDSIDLNSVVAINPGFTTLVFKQTGNKSKETNCFSIISKERSLDLEASNQDIARQWVEGLRALLKYGEIMTPSELRKADEFAQRRELEEEARKNKALKKHENDRAKLRAARERAHRQMQAK